VTAPWITRDELPAPLPALPGGDAEWDATIALASEVLWALTGRRWAGERTRTVAVVAPVAGSDLPPGWSWSWGPVHPALIDGEVHNCTCTAAERVRLPDDDVTAVEEVTVSGTPRPAGSYALDRGHLLDLTGRGWPTSPPGFTVRYRHGRPPPDGGRRAAALLAREHARARVGDPASPLLLNLVSRTRQAITETFVPAADLIERGQTGVPQVDAWVATVNPGKLTRRARAWSPDTAPALVRRVP
jgi:hypothetical protein